MYKYLNHMKKLMSLLVLVLAFTITAQAQKKRVKKYIEKLTVEQQASLIVKKMTLELELSDKQQDQVKPLVLAQVKDRRVNYEKMKELKKKYKENKKEVTADTRYKMANAQLDKRIAFQREMKAILNEAQYERFKKLEKNNRKRMKGKMMKRKKMMKKHKKHMEHKEYKEEHEEKNE